MLADALIAAGDPRGELIVLQSQLARRPDDRDVNVAEAVALRSAWGELAPIRAHVYERAWRLGFLDEITVHPNAGSDIVARIRNAPVTRWLRSLRSVSNLKATPDDLSGFVNLRTLDVGFPSESDFHAFAALPRISSLSVCGELSAAAIANVPGALQTLRLGAMSAFTDDHIAATSSIPTLRELGVSSTSTFSDAAFARLGEGVSSLSVSLCKTTSAIFEHLARQRLANLQIYADDRIDGAELARLEGGTLEHLGLAGVSNPEHLLAATAEHARLRTLYLECSSDYQPVNAGTLGRVLGLRELRSFELHCAGAIEGEVVLDTRVTSVRLSASRVSPGFAAALAKLPLTQLHLPENFLTRFKDHVPWVDDAYLAQLSANAALEDLDLARTIITDVGLRAFQGHARLAKLALPYCARFTSRGLADLVASLPALRELAVTDVDASVLAAAASRSDLRSLKISSNTIDDAALAALLPAAATLRELDVRHCPITLDAVPVLAQLQALDRLVFGPFHMEDDLEREIARALRPLLPNCFIDV